MMKEETSPAGDSVTIRGLLLPVDWDEKGNITETAVSTYFEEDYHIERNDRGESLLPFLRQKVKVIGPVRMNDSGRKVIRVEEYEVIEDPELVAGTGRIKEGVIELDVFQPVIIPHPLNPLRLD